MGGPSKAGAVETFLTTVAPSGGSTPATSAPSIPVAPSDPTESARGLILTILNKLGSEENSLLQQRSEMPDDLYKPALTYCIEHGWITENNAELQITAEGRSAATRVRDSLMSRW